MNKKLTKSFFEHILICYVLLIPFVPIFGVIDRIGPQFLYLSITQMVVYCYLFFFRRKDISIKFLKDNVVVVTYCIFIFISLASFSFSINIIESLVEWNQYFTFFNSFLTIVLLMHVNSKLHGFILKMLIVLLGLEVLKTLSVFFEYYDSGKSFTRIREYQGFSSNQNIGAFAILIKTPLLIYFILKAKQKYLLSFLFVLLMISIFSILIIGSRGAILGLVIFIFFSIIWISLSKETIVSSVKKKFLIVCSIIFFVGIFQNTLFKDSEIALSKRSVSLLDESTNYRLERYKDAIHHILKNPFIGTGIGTWKIKASDYGRRDMMGYQVAYHAHNDFLQIGAETGLFGMLSYISIFCVLIFYSYKNYNLSLSFEDKFLYLTLFLMVLIFMIDSSLNFPRIRPYSQIVILYVMGFISIKSNKLRLKK